MTRVFSRWRSKWLGEGRCPRLPENSLTRRSLFGALLAFPLRGAQARQPETSAFDLSLLYDWVTPNELFFVREHFPAPTVSAHGWKLSITGAVGSPIEIGYEDLLRQQRRMLPATIECAENPVGGGLVSHAEWEGVPLADVLKTVQPRAEARFVRLSSTDTFERIVPLSKAQHADTLLAFRMSGQSLPSSHGGPMRAIIPGWYGMDSVKWLRKIELLENAPAANDYRRSQRSLLTGVMPGDPLTSILVKSVFSRPQDGAVLSGRRFILRGAAWAGENLVRSVEVSVDSGTSWLSTRFPAPQRYCWVHWEQEWKIPAPGEYELLVRATDDRGNVQPLSRQSNRVDSYEQNSCQHVTVSVI